MAGQLACGVAGSVLQRVAASLVFGGTAACLVVGGVFG